MTLKGGQLGNSNASKGKTWREALDKALKQYVNTEAGIARGQALFRIATNVVVQALDGNSNAIQEIGNRMDGKPHQSMDIGIHDTLPVEEMTDAELAADIAETRELIAGNTVKAKRKTKPSDLH